MPYKLGGYVMQFDAARRVMATLEIPDKGVNDIRLEWPINDWLAKNGKLDVLAAGIIVPGSDSEEENATMIISSFEWSSGADVSNAEPVLVEGERDLKVKKWLVEEGGAREEEELSLRWTVIWDLYGITRCGIQPRENNVQGQLICVEATYEELIAAVLDGIPDSSLPPNFRP